MFSNANSSQQEQDIFRSVYVRADRLFAIVMAVQATGLLVMSLTLTPQTWAGTTSSVHTHVWVSAIMGLLITVFPAMLAIARPGEPTTRMVMAVCQGLVSSLLIHIGGGRLEMHFHVFVSLAFLAMYMDFPVLLTATVIIATDHLVRGLMWPQSIYGITQSGILRTMEHAIWVVFEVIVLFVGIRRNRHERRQLMGAVQSINQCVYALTGNEPKAGSEVESIMAGLETIRLALLRMEESVGSVRSQSGELQNRAQQAISILSSGVSIADVSQGSIYRLRDAVKEISVAVAEINSIAEQTRLLSLNATIEAARSAESGQGFGVVARNVKELAVKSGTAAARISRLAENCEECVKESSSSTNSVVTQLHEIRSIVDSTNGVITDIQESVIASAREAQQMAHAFSKDFNRTRRQSSSMSL
jgi:methyl-accepting chemotaxis protein